MLMRVGGKDTEGPDGRWIDVKNPATGVLIDRVPSGTPDDVAHAVDAAESAFGSWKKKPMRERGLTLFRAARLSERAASGYRKASHDGTGKTSQRGNR